MGGGRWEVGGWEVGTLVCWLVKDRTVETSDAKNTIRIQLSACAGSAFERKGMAIHTEESALSALAKDTVFIPLPLSLLSLHATVIRAMHNRLANFVKEGLMAYSLSKHQTDIIPCKGRGL